MYPIVKFVDLDNIIYKHWTFYINFLKKLFFIMSNYVNNVKLYLNDVIAIQL